MKIKKFKTPLKQEPRELETMLCYGWLRFIVTKTTLQHHKSRETREVWKAEESRGRAIVTAPTFEKLQERVVETILGHEAIVAKEEAKGTIIPEDEKL